MKTLKIFFFSVLSERAIAIRRIQRHGPRRVDAVRSGKVRSLDAPQVCGELAFENVVQERRNRRQEAETRIAVDDS